MLWIFGCSLNDISEDLSTNCLRLSLFRYINHIKKKTSFFSISVFFTGTDDLQGSRGEDHLLFHSSTSTLSRTLTHLFATLHVRWLSRIFNGNACAYQTATLYHLIELPFEWLIDDSMFVCLLDELILGFCYNDLTLETGGFELALTITLVFQRNRLTKRANSLNLFL